MYNMWGDVEGIPSNNSNTIVKNKVSELATLETASLDEGETPTEQSFSLTRIEKSLDQYGGYIRTSDRLSEESINGLTAEFSKRLGQQAARTMNLVRRDGLLGGSNVRIQNGEGGVGGDTDDISTPLTGTMVATDMDFMLDAFRAAYVKPFTPLHGGSPNEGTAPIPSGYVVVVPVAAIDVIRAATGFDEVEAYGGQTTLLHGNEFGRYRNFRFIYDTEVKVADNTNGTAQSVAQCLVFGQGLEDKAYCTVDLAGGNTQMITKPLGSSGSADPLNQRASMGWKAKQATFIIQDTYMFRWEISLGAA
jgi:N4-gp56 family major capsid protein